MCRANLSLCGIAIIIALISSGEAAIAEDLTSANYVMPGCRGFASDRPPADLNLELSFKAGLCVGAIRSFEHLELTCPPTKVTDQQAALVILQYIDARPVRIHENFAGLALQAMQAAWPCKR
jgi:hypothetical protein